MLHGSGVFEYEKLKGLMNEMFGIIILKRETALSIDHKKGLHVWDEEKNGSRLSFDRFIL